MKLIFTLLLSLTLFSCASSDNEKVQYKSTKSRPTLEIPPNLTTLKDTENRSLPHSTVGTRDAIARYKDSGELVDRVLPKLSGIQLKGQGDYHWLEVQQGATQVYDLLKEFWLEEGFTLERDEPLIGFMQTEWLENKAGLLFADDSFLSQMLSNLSSTDTKDQYRTRVERIGETVTHVYLSQSGREFMLIDEDSLSGKNSGWQSRPSEPDVEAEMLSRMMLFLGLQDEQVKLQLAQIGQFPARARIVKNEDDETSLVVAESFDRAWNRTLLMLDRMNVEYVSQDRNEGLIRIKHQQQDKEKKGFFRHVFSDDDDTDESFVIPAMNIGLQQTVSKSTEIIVFTDDNVKDSSEQGLALLQNLFEQLK